MALRDDERRKLARIERALLEEDPLLARQLAEWQPIGASSVAAVIAGVLVTLWAGLIIIAVGVQTASPLLVVVGATVAAVLPALASRRVRRRRGRL